MEGKKYIKLEPYVGEDAIYYPVRPYAEEGSPIADYRVVLTRELFVGAYNKWIKNATAGPSEMPEVFTATTAVKE